MQLVSLKVLKSTTNEIIRDIPFNPRGLSLIVDNTNKVGSGSNIGKTTAVKIIDLCVGANSVSSLYKEKDTGENTIVKEFLDKHKVVAELHCEINGETHIFKRALYRNGKNEIDGELVTNMNEYRSNLNKLIFNNFCDKPSLRQLISKFIRLENANENALLKFLGVFPKTYEYQAIYDYLFGVGESKSRNIKILSLNESIDKDIDAIYRKNSVSSLREFETKITLMREEVEKFKKAYSELSVVDDYEDKIKENQALFSTIEKLEAQYSKLSLKEELLEEKIQKEKKKISLIDTKRLKQLYDETKLTLDKQLCDFEELEKFHNEMVNKRITVLQTAFSDLHTQCEETYGKLQQYRKLYEVKFVNFNVELKDKFEQKYDEYSINRIKLENYKNDYDYVIEKLKEKDENLKNKVTENNDVTKKDEIEESLNKYFKNLTDNIIGEPFAIVLNENVDTDEFPVRIVGLNGKPGTGIKKAMITCFDLAHIDLIIEKNYHMPIYAIHDKMENIDLNELSGIISETRKFQGQYVFPILSDRIELMGIKEEEIVLSLSAKDKFFHI